jgi:hypothetical protein
MVDLDATIIPGKGASGISIGTNLRDLPEGTRPQSVTPLLSGGLKHDLGSVKIWSKDGVITQVGVYSGYRGTLRSDIRVGSTLAEVEDCFGCPVEENDEDNLVVPGFPGLCFDTEEWGGNHTISENRNARITAIYVFKVDHEASRRPVGSH